MVGRTAQPAKTCTLCLARVARLFRVEIRPGRTAHICGACADCYR